MTFAIAGVSGNTGKVVADTLLSQGKKVRVIVRDAKKGEPWKAKGAEVAVADLSDVAAVTKALTGAEGAYLLVPPNYASPTFLATQAGIVKALTAAIGASKVPHVVLLSSVGAQHDAGTGPIVTVHLAEKAFAGIAGTVFSFLRAGYFLENVGGSLAQLDQGILPSFTPAKHAFSAIATVDIGRLAAQLLVEGAKKNQIVELGSPTTFEAFAAALSKITGKPVQVAEAPVDAMAGVLKGHGFTDELAGLFAEMTRGINGGKVAFEGTHRSVAASTSAETVFRGLLGKA
jgi:uncharacterized protein YbjT (DUF2867 family)